MDLWAELAKQDAKVQEIVNGILKREILELLIDIEHCESPIERLMHVSLARKVGKMQFINGNHMATVINQAEIDCYGKKYRVDFLIIVTDFRDHEDMIKVVVECDGHEFHEKTKEQSTRDKKRDREMLACGYRVLRFTGQEIWKDAMRCAKEVENTIREFYKEKW